MPFSFELLVRQTSNIKPELWRVFFKWKYSPVLNIIATKWLSVSEELTTISIISFALCQYMDLQSRKDYQGFSQKLLQLLLLLLVQIYVFTSPGTRTSLEPTNPSITHRSTRDLFSLAQMCKCLSLTELFWVKCHLWKCTEYASFSSTVYQMQFFF